uniref:helix-turn-helix domain-containing protein n=1 Tax=Clostridium symbiosum TaxID=1512 RepID=UPI001FABC6E7
MNLQWLYYFNTIAELEHYTRAAERLHVSQSNLSHAIKELEEELGAELFERKGRNIKLTTNHERLSQPLMKIGYWLRYFSYACF